MQKDVGCLDTRGSASIKILARHQWLRRQRSEGSWFKANPIKLFVRHYLKKKPSQKWAGGVAQGKDPEFKPQYCNKKKKKATKLPFPDC
jgi:hypothetical protein